MNFRQNSTDPSELVFGIVGPIGCNRKLVIETMKSLAKHYSYKVVVIGVSDLIRNNANVFSPDDDQYIRVTNLIDAGNQLRLRTKDNSLLAKLAALEIAKERDDKIKKRIYVVDSIKHPEEIEELRHIYGAGFYLFAVHSSQSRRDHYLEKECGISDPEKRNELIAKDGDEQIGHGQSTSEAFHRADFFLSEEGNNTKIWNTLERFFDIIFGDPFKTPTFGEFAMFMAYGASMRSADMSRQVGAVITKETDILSIGANECPRPLGGTYWPNYDPETGLISDTSNGRDYMRKVDRNGLEKQRIIDALKRDIPPEVIGRLEANINSSGLKDTNEYGRVVHAEMDAILGCARRGTECGHSTIYCTTFPCHNCAKHIIASGINRVIYIEPYPKSKAYEMHDDAIKGTGDATQDQRVLFTPFVGVGPRQFVNLFSLTLSSGARVKRKKPDSFEAAEWNRKNALPRLKMYPLSHRDNEVSVQKVRKVISAIKPVVIS